jgi:hypothetical protein
MRRSAPLLLLVGLSLGLPLAACQTPARDAPPPPKGSVIVEEVDAWRDAATPAGVTAVDVLDSRWIAAIAEAKRRGATRTIAAEGPLLEARASLPRAAPAPGPYRCRLLRVGAPGARTRGLVVSRSAFCFIGVEGDQLSFTSEVPGQRLGGYLHETRTSRELVFLGTAAGARGQAVLGYGEDASRDRAGRFERVGEFRYRLLIAAAAAPELLVFELVAAPAD